MAIEAMQTNHELETLRIVRPQEQPRRKRSRLVSIAILMLLLTVLGAASYVIYVKTIGRSPTVQTMMVVARTDRQSSVLLTGSGYIVTRHKYIIIGTKILGQIVEEPIEEGQHIKAGDVLARIDDRDYQAQLRQAIASRYVAKANLHLLQNKADRARYLIKTGAISKDDFETAITAAGVGQAELERDGAAVDYAKFNVNQCVISSPINGIVLKKYRELGDTINFGGQIEAGGGSTDIAQLADTDDMRAEVDINEADIAKVGIGSPGKLEPVITVPKSAVRHDEGEAYVWTVREGIVRRVSVVCGLTTETGIEVRQGLKDGDSVVITPDVKLVNGGKVSVR